MRIMRVVSAASPPETRGCPFRIAARHIVAWSRRMQGMSGRPFQPEVRFALLGGIMLLRPERLATRPWRMRRRAVNR